MLQNQCTQYSNTFLKIPGYGRKFKPEFQQIKYTAQKLNIAYAYLLSVEYLTHRKIQMNY